MPDLDVTESVYFGENDGEYMPLTQCVCGHKFYLWDFILGIYRDMASACPSCGRKLYFCNSIRVYEVTG